MKATTSILALVAVAGAQAASLRRRHEHHRRGDYDYPTPTADASCKPVVTGKWVELKVRAPEAPSAPTVFTYAPPAACTVPTPVVTNCDTPGTYVFPEQRVTLATAGSYGGVWYEAGEYCQTAATYTVAEPTVITCAFEATNPTPAPENNKPQGDYPQDQPQGGDSSPEDEYNQGKPAHKHKGGKGKKGKGKGNKGKGYGGGSSGAPTGGKQWAVTYSPYQDDHQCRSPEEIASDIGQIAGKGFRSVRVYSTDCKTLESVGPACRKHGMKMIVGAFIKKGDGMATANQDLDALCKWGERNWDLVEMVVLGNEAVLGGACSMGELQGFLKSGSARLKSAGCTAPVTTAETLNIYEQHPDLCNYIDVAAINCHPFFNPQNTPGKSGSFLRAQLNELSGICGGKKPYSLETGWPNQGDANGAAVPGPSQQAEAFQSIYEADEGEVCYFTWTRDGWKGPGAFNVEPNFGCGSLFKAGGGL